MTNDIFANIAAGGIGGRADELEIPKPKQFSVENCILDDAEGTTPIKTAEKISSKTELYDELSKLKKALSPFLNNEAPEIENYKKIIPIKNFLLNNEKKSQFLTTTVLSDMQNKYMNRLSILMRFPIMMF